MLSDENYTPLWLLPFLNTVLGHIDLDPTAEPTNRLGANQFYTKDNSCLDEEWVATSVFMNPPFSRSVPFVEKFLEEYSLGHFPMGIMLLLSGALHNYGTGSLLHGHYYSICHWSGRLEFDCPYRHNRGRNSRDIVLLGFGKTANFHTRFHKTFQQFGIISHAFPFYQGQ